MTDFLPEVPAHPKYVRVYALSSLDDGVYLYEANIDLPCGKCGAIIPVNSFFVRGLVHTHNPVRPVPLCRTCRPFDIYVNRENKVAVPRDEEYKYVTDEEDE